MGAGKFSVLFSCIFFGLMQCILCTPKMCTNSIPKQATSHSSRYALDHSGNETLKAEVYSHYHNEERHLIPTDDSQWSRLKPPGRSNLENQISSVEEDFKWAILYKRMRYNLEVNSASNAHGSNFLEEIPLHNVRLDQDSVHGTAQKTNLEYLMLLEVDRLVWSFRKTAGLSTPGTPYAGWEAPDVELRGHFVGHYMSSSAMTWAATHNETIHQRMTSVVSILHECQQATGTGYLSAFPSEEFDRYEKLEPVWAPYYTIHKIMAGLLDQYIFGGNAQALNMTAWMADYFYNRVQNVIKEYSLERHWDAQNEEFGGMNDVLYRLYTHSGDQKHLELAHLFDKPCFLGLLAVQADDISELHANTHIPIIVGAQMRYEVTGDSLYKDISTFFLDIVNSSHSYATGGTSVTEFWYDPKRIATQLTTENEESCTTYNMLKVARNLFRWTKEMVYADYYERALTNGVLSLQRGTQPGVMIYMLPQGRGVSKAHSLHGWGTKYNSFWCCYGTAIESFAKLGDSIYFQEKGIIPSLYIIQFIASTLIWDSVGFTMRQVVQPPSSLNPYLQVSMEFSTLKDAKVENEESIVNIRIPYWTRETASAMINTEKLSLPYPGNFLTIKRKWLSGDKVSLLLPVGLSTEKIKDDRLEYQSIKAILFGPYLLVGMSHGTWGINVENESPLSDWVKAVPTSYASQLFTLGQEGKIFDLHEAKENNTLVSTYNSTLDQIIMNPLPRLGTDEAAYATFRIVDSIASEGKSNSAMDFVGKNVYLEPFPRPGVVVVHRGIDKNVTLSHRVDMSLANKENASIFKVSIGLDGDINSISFESIDHPSCFLYGGKNYQVAQPIRLRCIPKTRDSAFNRAVSFTANRGMSTYHPMSFIASGSNINYLLTPLLAIKDENYTAYFNITRHFIT